LFAVGVAALASGGVLVLTGERPAVQRRETAGVAALVR
jgi:hypothetical protein